MLYGHRENLVVERLPLGRRPSTTSLFSQTIATVKRSNKIVCLADTKESRLNDKSK